MKRFLVGMGWIFLLVTTSCPAVTLKLNPQIELLVLDGRKISGSLLKGADSLELEQGQHQFLVRVEAQPASAAHGQKPYHSPPIVVTFTAQAKTLSIHLPALENRRAQKQFERALNFQLVDEHNQEIASQRDRLTLTASTDIEKALAIYNLNHRVASVPRFAASRVPSPLGEAEFASTGEESTPVLKRWFQRFDQTTRQQIISLVKSLMTS